VHRAGKPQRQLWHSRRPMALVNPLPADRDTELEAPAAADAARWLAAQGWSAGKHAATQG